MGWNPMRQFQNLSEPAFFASAEGFNIFPFLGTANGGAQYDGDDIYQLMSFVVFTRIR